MNDKTRPVAIFGGNRIPFARSNGYYLEASNQDMLTAAIDGLVEKTGLAAQRLGEVAGGAVVKLARDINLTRESVLGTKLAPETPAYDVGQACGTGLEAAILVANKIALGQIDAAVAAGTDTTSDPPIAVSDDLRRVLVEISAARGTVDRLKAVAKLRPGMPLDVPENAEPRTGLSMGEHTAIMAKEWGLTRAEQDQLAVASHQHLAASYESGFQDELVTPFLGLERDDNLRPDSTVEKLAKLRPVFGGEDGTMTAANSTPLTDGASAVLLGSEEWGAERGLERWARLVDAETAAVDFVGKREGLLMAPAYAVPRMLERNGLKLQDFDRYEIHEAFAAQVLCTLRAWEDPVFCKERLGLDEPLGEIDRAKLNQQGGSLAAGHPFAATGGRIVASLAKQLRDNGGGRGLISICAAGGQGVVAILES
jgi:acetyl-CoA C-acetyltransferase